MEILLILLHTGKGKYEQFDNGSFTLKENKKKRQEQKIELRKVGRIKMEEEDWGGSRGRGRNQRNVKKREANY